MRFGRPKHRKPPEIGALELEILKRLWTTDGALDARSLLDALHGRGITLSTVQGTLERLYRKGLVARSKQSRAYLYTASVTREELISMLIGGVAERLAEGRLEPVITGFVDLLGDSDPTLLDQLESRVKRRRTKE